MLKKTLGLLLIALLAIALVSGCGNKQSQPGQEPDSSGVSNLEKSLALDISTLKSSDGQPLLLEMQKKEIPPRPANPNALPEEDAMRWYDLEYAGWSAKKINIPNSPVDGAIGKKVITIINGDHPYLTAYGNGMKKVADAYNIDLKIMSPNWNIDVQNQMIDQAINARPDMIIVVPLDAKVAINQLRKINQAGIPVIASNMLPEDDGMQYVIGWTGPDDWGQMRMLAQKFAELMKYEGNYAVVQHAPGGSPYFARTYGIVTELKRIAPNMKVLDMQAPGFEAERTMQVTADWITRFGSDLKGVMASDDSAQMIGINEAIKNANREDIIRISAGNSKVGMDALKAGTLHAITYQSAEADGAVALKMAVDWFNGLEIEPVRYLPKHIITSDDVNEFMPAQW
jgi:ribose transport system substrate-binding protein